MKVAGIEVRTSTVIVVAILLLFIAAMVVIRAPGLAPARPTPTAIPPTVPPTATPVPSPTPVPPTPTPTPEPTATTPAVQAVGEWRAAPGLAGGIAMAACTDFKGTFTRLDDPALVEAAARAYPAPPDVPNLIAVGKPLYIPRTGDDVAADVEAWLQAPETDCEDSPWSDEATQAFLKAQENNKVVAFFGIARPVVENGAEKWEVVFYAVEQ